MSCHSVIEIGTNSVKLLIAELEGGLYRQLLNTKVPTRFGEGLPSTGSLRTDAIDRTVDVVGMLLADALGLQPRTVQIIATSAARDASNRDELTTAVASATGLTVEILSGEAEGELMYHAVLAESSGDPGPILLVDLGGGSTQVVLGKGPQLLHVSSHAMGTLRFFESLGVSDQPKPLELERCHREVEAYLAKGMGPAISKALSELGGESVHLVGAGGSIRALGKLAALETGQKMLPRIHHEKIKELRTRLWSLSLHERKRLEGMPRNKADLILVGVVIVDCCLAMLGLSELTVSGQSVRHGALLRKCDLPNPRP